MSSNEESTATEILIEDFKYVSLLPSSRQDNDIILFLSEKELRLLTTAYERYARHKLTQHNCYVKRTLALGKTPKEKDTERLKLKLRVDAQSVEDVLSE